MFPNAWTIVTATIRTPCDGVCIYNPIDCDDGSACTADSCNAGNCVNALISCDDGNSCTSDSRDTILGCPNTINPACCGNGVCEPGAGENTSTCFEDCAIGPFTITTPVCSSCYFKVGTCLTWKPRIPILPSLPSRCRFTLLEMSGLQRCGRDPELTKALPFPPRGGQRSLVRSDSVCVCLCEMV